MSRPLRRELGVGLVVARPRSAAPTGRRSARRPSSAGRHRRDAAARLPAALSPSPTLSFIPALTCRLFGAPRGGARRTHMGMGPRESARHEKEKGTSEATFLSPVAAVAATGALALAAGTAGAHPDRTTTDAGSTPRSTSTRTRTAPKAPCPAELSVRPGHQGPEAGRQDDPRPRVRRLRPGRRRLGEGQLRLPDDVLRAAVRPWRRPDRGHLQPGEPGQARLHPEPRGHVLGRGLAGRDDGHARHSRATCSSTRTSGARGPPTASAASRSST